MKNDPPARGRLASIGRNDRVWAGLLLACLAQMGILEFLLRPRGLHPGYTNGLVANTTTLMVFLAGALALRCAMRWARSRDLAGAVRATLEGRLLLDLGCILVVMWSLIEAYSWTKVMVPALHARLFDGELSALDEVVFFGHNPNVLLLALFRAAPFGLGRAVEWYYGQFVGTMLAFAAWFLTAPRAAQRVGFAAGFVTTWLVGSWIYVACPSLGPAYVYSDLFREVHAAFPGASATQLTLMVNRDRLLRILNGEVLMINPLYGVAAMPSLHVAAHALCFYWAAMTRSRWRSLLLLSTGVMFLGSIATGWHYAVDSLAALLLAALGLAMGWGVARYVGAATDSSAGLEDLSVSSRQASQ